MKARAALAAATARLGAAGADDPALDAELLLARALHKNREWIFAHGEDELDIPAAVDFETLLARRAAGEPVAYILGVKEFFSLRFEVGPGVFIPRPETEGLVELAREEALRSGARTLVDVCTGSGAVAVAARLFGGFEEVHATEASPEALAFARRNAAGLGARIAFHLGDLMEPLSSTDLQGRIDVICCNPPYVRTGELPALPQVVKCEPAMALDGGADGLDVVRRLAREAAVKLRAGGRLFVEIGHGQSEGAMAAAEGAGLVGLRVLKDLAGLERYLVAERAPA